MIFCMTMSLFASSVIAQEVRGCSTRRVVYEGEEYYKQYSSEKSNKYYGWEITNHNSFSISVDLTMYHQGGVVGNRYSAVSEDKQVVKTQSIILKPKESYVFKREEHRSTRVDNPDSDNPISSYFVEYKAYKIH